MARVEINGSSKEVEIYFDHAPSASVLDEVKKAGFHWNKGKVCWCAKQTEERLEFAKRIVAGISAGIAAGDSVGKQLVGAVSSALSGSVPSALSGAEASETGKYCYADTMENFLGMEKSAWMEEMRSAFVKEIDLPLEQPQIDAWDDCFDVLQRELVGDLSAFHIIFEYALSYERGRRPDVLLVSNEAVIILEFKRKPDERPEDLDQAANYKRDISAYHYESRDKVVIPMLVLTRAKNLSYEKNKVRICSGDKLMENIRAAISSIGTMTPCDIDRWIYAKYETLPTMVESARAFWKGKELPNIKQVHAGTNLDEAMACLKRVTEDAASKKKNVLALVTGVPGAGKTFLGLQFVYDVCRKKGQQNSVFLSGNGPLVEVLQDALQTRSFVMDVNNVVQQFLNYKAPDFNKNIVVFDEGQRAWDEDRMKKRYRDKSAGKTEPDVLVQLCDERLDWCVFLVLVGEGQEINEGENGGIVQWYNAIQQSKKKWNVVCPGKLAEVFQGADVEASDDLDLKVSIRSHTAGEVSNFVNKFVAGELEEAAGFVPGILEQGFHMYYTRNLSRAKSYCKDEYADQPNKRYGMLVSSKVKRLSYLGMPQPIWEDKVKYYPDGSGRRWQVAPWFNRDPDHPDSCCALKVAITEFDCQGLEIDMPIVGWGEDAEWVHDHWKFKGADEEKVTYRNNSYRVLLTRGREGFIVFIPPERDDIAAIFERVGIEKLPDRHS